MKKTLAFILAFMLSFAMIPAGLITGAATGEVVNGYTPVAGSVAISSVAEFERIGTGNYHLTKDLDFENKTYTDSIIKKLSGTLDGCGFSIKNIKVSSSSADAGIIGEILNSGTVKNLVVGTKANPARVESTKTGKTVAGLIAVAKCADVSVENVKIYTEVKSLSTAAGIIGYLAASNSASVKGCEVDGSIYCNTGATAGGVIGRIKDSVAVRVEDSVNLASVTLENSTTKWGVGGIIATAERGVTVINCVNKGDVSTDANHAGGILGFMSISAEGHPVTIQKCSNYGTVSGMNTGNQGNGKFDLKPTTRNAAIGGIFGGTKDFDDNRENTVTIDKCMNYGLVKTNGASAGAIMGKGIETKADQPTVKIVIKDTGNVGNVEYGNTEVEVGSFVSVCSTSSIGGISISNCYNMGKTNSQYAYAGVFNILGDSTLGNASVSDFYYLDTEYFWAANGYVSVSNATPCTTAQFRSGEVAFNLGFNFGQVIGVDEYPVPGGLAVVSSGASSFSNLQRLSTKAGGASAPYVQVTDDDGEGKQSVRFIIAVDSKLIENAESAQMVITFKKEGASDVSYTLTNEEIKLFKSVHADGTLYLAQDNCAILGATVKGVGCDAWSSVQMTFTVKDASGAEIPLMSVSGSFAK